MKRKIWTPLAILTMIITFGCSTKTDDTNHQEAVHEDWKEMDDFHMFMAEAFHPYKDSANLAPARLYADSLVAAAERWANASLPAKFEDDDEVKFKLNQLKTDAATFARVAKTGDDKVTGESLTKLHDLFHAIQESWYGGHGDHH